MASSAPVLLVIWHSLTGATEAAVLALANGAASEPDVAVRCLRAADAAAEDVLGADAVVFATPETLGSISGGMKDFFDRSYYPLLDQCAGKACALLVCAGSDGRPTLAQLQRIATGLRLRCVAEPLLIHTHAQTPAAIAAHKQLSDAQRQQAHDLGAMLAAGLALGLF